MAYYELYYHLAWATKNREPVLQPELETPLHEYLRGKGLALGGIVHAVGGVADHVHVAVSLPPRLAVGTYVGQLKGASSHWVNHLAGFAGAFAWQEGYGALSFGKRSLPQVVAYVLGQPDHHCSGSTLAQMERTEGENENQPGSQAFGP